MDLEKEGGKKAAGKQRALVAEASPSPPFKPDGKKVSGKQKAVAEAAMEAASFSPPLASSDAQTPGKGCSPSAARPTQSADGPTPKVGSNLGWANVGQGSNPSLVAEKWSAEEDRLIREGVLASGVSPKWRVIAALCPGA